MSGVDHSGSGSTSASDSPSSPMEAPPMSTDPAALPTPLMSRQGREKQRYTQDSQRLVAGCIPVRDNPRVKGGVEVCMVSNRHNDGLIFPKGGWETDETAEEAAARESMEEAGVKGETCTYVGEFSFKSRKKALKKDGVENGGKKATCVARVFVMNVTEEMAEWPEQATRTRTWLPAMDAIEQCKHDWMRDALRAWASTMPGLETAG
mmetsp:Transcript_321/g.1196  ORF Transcript_321/g.1196 Transcript_321/m.1196 type:complete len:207 (-) Transcript_321:191-811(-)